MEIFDLLGDAAGLASGFTGRANHQALVSGEEIGADIQMLIINLIWSDCYVINDTTNGFMRFQTNGAKVRVLLYYAGIILLKFSKKWRTEIYRYCRIEGSC
ncbi:MAG: hypothetical protein QM751_06845 [Paludibacteraceae bacterium]